MTLISINNTMYDLRLVELYASPTDVVKKATLTISFGGASGGVEYSATKQDKEKYALIYKVFHFIEEKLSKDVPVVWFEKAMAELDKLNFREVSYVNNMDATGGIKSCKLKKPSSNPLNGIFIKAETEDGITLTKVGADKFKVKSATIHTVKGCNFRLYIHGSPNRIYPTLEYILRGDIRFLEKEEKSKTGVRNHCEEIIYTLAEKSAVVSLNEVESILRGDLYRFEIARTSMLNTN